VNHAGTPGATPAPGNLPRLPEVPMSPQNVRLLAQDRPGELNGLPPRRVMIEQFRAFLIALA